MKRADVEIRYCTVEHVMFLKAEPPEILNGVQALVQRFDAHDIDDELVHGIGEIIRKFLKDAGYEPFIYRRKITQPRRVNVTPYSQKTAEKILSEAVPK